MIPYPSHIPFADFLGARLVRYENGESELHCDPNPDMLNSFQVVHGGAIMGLLDLAMGFAARSHGQTAEGAAATGFLTIEMKTSFLQAALGPLVVRGRVIHKTTTMAFCEGSLLNAAGELVAHATGTFKLVRAVPTGDRTVNRVNGPKADAAR